MTTRRSKRGKEAAPPIDQNAGIPRRKKRKRPYNKKVVAKKQPAKKKEKKNKKNKKNKNVNFIVEEIEGSSKTKTKIVARTYPSKPKEAQRKDNQVFYDRHFFEVLRNQTIRRMYKGYRIMYPTLKKYQIIEEYLNIAPPEYIKKFKNEEIFYKRTQNQLTPFINETAVRVANALNANAIGTAMVPKDIKIVINAADTPDAANLDFNENSSFENDFSVEVNGAFPQAPRPKPKASERDKVFTFDQVKNFFMGPNYYVKKGNRWEPPTTTTRKQNVDNIIKLMRILKCIKGNNKNKSGFPIPRGDENVADCFGGNQQEIEAKVRKISTAPNIKSGKAPTNGNKNIIGTIQALARDNTKHMSKFRKVVGDNIINEWEIAFTQVMNKFRNKEKKKRENNSLIAISWTKLLDVQAKLKAAFKEKQKLFKKKRATKLEVIDANLDYVLWSLYTLQPPRRDDYGYCRMIDKSVGGVLGRDRVLSGQRTNAEGVIIQSATRHTDPAYPKKGFLNYYSLTQKLFLFQRYKTAPKYGQRIFKLKDLKAPLGKGTQLAAILAESYKLYPRVWLFEKVREDRRSKAQKLIGTPRASLTSEIKRIATKYKITNPSGRLGVNMFRHSFVTYLYKVKKINKTQKFELAAMMLHDQKTAESTYLYALAKNKSQTIDDLAEENDEKDVANNV